MPQKTEQTNKPVMQMFEVGAHYGYSSSRRHPSVQKYIYGAKNSVEIFDLEKTFDALERAKAFVTSLAKQGGRILFVSSKHEARDAIVSGADSVNQPYVAGRWVGGTLTNFSQIRKRVEKLEELREQRQKGGLEKYTKKEQLLIDREIESLEEKFGGIVDMDKKPAAFFIVDPREESIAIAEAKRSGVPVIALSNTDCNISEIDYPIPGNDANRESITYFVNEIVSAIQEGKSTGESK